MTKKARLRRIVVRIIEDIIIFIGMTVCVFVLFSLYAAAFPA